MFTIFSVVVFILFKCFSWHTFDYCVFDTLYENVMHNIMYTPVFKKVIL